MRMIKVNSGVRHLSYDDAVAQALDVTANGGAGFDLSEGAALAIAAAYQAPVGAAATFAALVGGFPVSLTRLEEAIEEAIEESLIYGTLDDVSALGCLRLWARWHPSLGAQDCETCGGTGRVGFQLGEPVEPAEWACPDCQGDAPACGEPGPECVEHNGACD